MDDTRISTPRRWILGGTRRQPRRSGATDTNSAVAATSDAFAAASAPVSTQHLRPLVPWFSARRSAQVAEAIAYLNAQCRVIRVGLEDAMGLGHQSASVHVAGRLRALGYRGVFEIVASEHSLPKLAALLHSLRGDGADPLVLSPREAAGRPGRVGVVGGWGNVSMTLNVRHCLILQPLQWTGERVVMDPGGTHPVRVGPFACFRYDAAPKVPLARVVSDTMPAVEAAALSQVVRFVESGRGDLMVVYGMHQLTRPRPAVKHLVDTLDGRPGRALCFVVDPYQSYQGAYDLDDPAELSHALGSAGPHVVTVRCKQLPEPVFRGLYALSTLPAILEGANTTNLMRLLGRPYLSVRTTSTPYPKLWGHAKARQTCERLAAMLSGRLVFDKAMLLDFMRAARQPTSAVGRYFSALQRGVQDPASDQVALGLIELHKSLVRHT